MAELKTRRSTFELMAVLSISNDWPEDDLETCAATYLQGVLQHYLADGDHILNLEIKQVRYYADSGNARVEGKAQ